MTPPSRKAAILTDYVFGVGLRLSLQLEELFEIEVRPIIEAARTREERFALQDGWQVLISRPAGSTRRYWEKGKITLGKERVISMLLRQLRSFEFIAIGGTEILGKVGPVALIMPRRWDSLIMTWGSDTVADDLTLIRNVHVARVDRLGEGQRRELDELLYTLSKQRFADTTESSKDAGRPPRKRAMVEAWITENVKNKRMPKKEEAAMSQALRHFSPELEKKQISAETIRTTIKAFYTAQN
jgi:hypothetical protein